MSKKAVESSPPLKLRVLCLVLVSLTACSAGREQYVWHDLGPVKQRPAQTPASPVSWGPKADDVNTADPEIAPGFLLTVNSVADRQLHGDYRVNFDGSLLLPYGVRLTAAGLPLSQLKLKLNDLYQRYFKTSTDIDVKVKEWRYWLDVRGLVEKPGQYLVDSGTSLDQLITLAGGTEKQPAPQYVRIQKGTKTFVVDLKQYYGQGEDYAHILGWYGGEVIFFQKDIAGSLMGLLPPTPYRLPIYMMGEVQKPGEYPVEPGSDFLDMLIQAGGFTNTADLKRIEIIRRTEGKERTFELSWNEFQRAPTPVQGDIIMVHSERQVGYERNIHIAALIASIVASAALIAEVSTHDW